MTRLPWDPAEIGTHEADLDGIADRLSTHAVVESDAPPMELANRIRAALDDEPLPASAWWQRLGGGTGGWQAPVRLLAAAAVLVAGVVGGLALGELAGQLQNSGSGSSPPAVVSPSPTPSPSPSPSPSPTLSPTPSATPLSSATLTPPPPLPSPDDETPEPSESDDSGGGNSGPGGGD